MELTIIVLGIIGLAIVLRKNNKEWLYENMAWWYSFYAR